MNQFCSVLVQFSQKNYFAFIIQNHFVRAFLIRISFWRWKTSCIALKCISESTPKTITYNLFFFSIEVIKSVYMRDFNRSHNKKTQGVRSGGFSAIKEHHRIFLSQNVVFIVIGIGRMVLLLHEWYGIEHLSLLHEWRSFSLKALDILQLIQKALEKVSLFIS